MRMRKKICLSIIKMELLKIIIFLIVVYALFGTNMIENFWGWGWNYGYPAYGGYGGYGGYRGYGGYGYPYRRRRRMRRRYGYYY